MTSSAIAPPPLGFLLAIRQRRAVFYDSYQSIESRSPAAIVSRRALGKRRWHPLLPYSASLSLPEQALLTLVMETTCRTLPTALSSCRNVCERARANVMAKLTQMEGRVPNRGERENIVEIARSHTRFLTPQDAWKRRACVRVNMLHRAMLSSLLAICPQGARACIDGLSLNEQVYPRVRSN